MASRNAENDRDDRDRDEYSLPPPNAAPIVSSIECITSTDTLSISVMRCPDRDDEPDDPAPDPAPAPAPPPCFRIGGARRPRGVRTALGGSALAFDDDDPFTTGFMTATSDTESGFFVDDAHVVYEMRSANSCDTATSGNSRNTGDSGRSLHSDGRLTSLLASEPTDDMIAGAGLFTGWYPIPHTFKFKHTPTMNPHVVVFVAGRMGAGKDALCASLTKHHGYTRFAYADALKRAALPLLKASWPQHFADLTLPDLHDRAVKEATYADTPFNGGPLSVRAFLQFLGTDVVRTQLGPDVWVDALAADIHAHLQASRRRGVPARVCISDVRFANEIAGCKAWLARKGHTDVVFHAVRVLRDGTGSSSPPSMHSHASEAQDFAVDGVVDNDGDLDDLAGAAHRLATAMDVAKTKASTRRPRDLHNGVALR